jgi:3'-5' exoribonuclease
LKEIEKKLEGLRMSLPVPLFGLVLDEEKRRIKDGDRYFWQVKLKTEAGIIKSIMWNAGKDAEKSPKFPHTGDIVEVTDYLDQLDKYGSITINAFKRTTREDLPDPSILEFEKASEEDIDWALDLIGDNSFWEDEVNHSFTMACLKRIDGDKLRACPAATHVHHQYHGGLLVHTAEVLEICRAITESSYKRYPFINKDVVYSSAILHDIGKVKTYSINNLGVAERLLTEKTIGHLFYGMYLVQKVFEEKPLGVEEDFVNEVLHCIASHHALPEWGSLKEVQSIEAGILSRVDYISSRNGMVDFVLKEAIQSESPLQESFKVYGDMYFASLGMRKYLFRGEE